MNIFSKLVTYDKNGKCLNFSALKEKIEKKCQAKKVKQEGKRRMISFIENKDD